MRQETHAAVRAAEDAGRILMRNFRRPVGIEKKSDRELVTEADRAAEDAIVAALRADFPDDVIITEESAPELTVSDRAWIVDPLDGTNNFAHGYPFFSVAVALEEAGVPVVGVVHDPLRGETFVAEEGAGAILNGDPIHVSRTASLRDALVATGFPYDRGPDTENNLANLNRFILAVRGVRRGGSAELDLVSVAAGRLDGFWELGLKIWDVAAGGLIVREAGGMVTNFGGSGWDHRRGDIAASNGAIQDEMLALIGQQAGEGT